MPSFYPRSMSRQLPLTPPEFVPTYETGSHRGLRYPGGCVQSATDFGSAEEGGQIVPGRFGPHFGMLSTAANFALQSNVAVSQAATRSGDSYYELLPPVLPPMRVTDRPVDASRGSDCREHEDPLGVDHEAKEDKVVGGVSAKLDYDMDRMTDFVCEMAQRIIQPHCTVQISFRKWVSQVLCATRLPSATIILSIHYLVVRMKLLSRGGYFQATEGQLYRLLTVALILGSKFLDDNTFINRSWSEVSGIRVSELNHLEVEWLIAIKFDLHRDPYEEQGFATLQGQWQHYRTRAVTRPVKPMQLAHLDTTVQRQRLIPQQAFSADFGHVYGNSSMLPLTTKPAQARYSAGPYAQYDAWSSRSGEDSSPPTAPHTGPPTPEYYGVGSGVGVWNSSEGYSRRTMFGFPPLQKAQGQLPYGQSPFSATAPRQSWNGHAPYCNCLYCQPATSQYLLAPAYGPEPVAG